MRKGVSHEVEVSRLDNNDSLCRRLGGCLGPEPGQWVRVSAASTAARDNSGAASGADAGSRTADVADGEHSGRDTCADSDGLSNSNPAARPHDGERKGSGASGDVRPKSRRSETFGAR